jgi:glycosyltransferase involved in cell wall biosynthesis
MANFGFIYTPSKAWVGGKNYYLALFNQLHEELNVNVDTVTIFTSNLFDTSELTNFKNFTIVQTKLLNPCGIYRFFYRVANKLLGENSILVYVLNKHKIDLLSHSYIAKWSKIKSLPWIPDFQHCLLPEFFSERHIKLRNLAYQKYLNNPQFILSSYSALNDAKIFFQVNGDAFIYRFRPRPFDEFNYAGYNELCRKHNINKPFVFLPNQFWKHKNHLQCFKSCLKAKNDGQPFQLVCSGGFTDHRNPEYTNEVQSFIQDNGMALEIVTVGLIDRSIFNCLMKESSLVVNPSKFEGWSTTVEEAKALGKPLALSNLSVHKEQTENMSNVEYFDIDNIVQCSNAIQKLLNFNPLVDDTSQDNASKKVDSLYDTLKVITYD